MTIQETRRYIEDISKRGSILGLESIKRLCRILSEDYPEKKKDLKEENEVCLLQDRIPAIHIAGTNGKGSVGAMLAAAYTENGLKVGHFSSPAVFRYEEMFQIDGRPIEEERLAGLYTEVEQACKKMEEEGLEHPTIFEVETAAAFLYFWQEDCQLMVIECGMGGESDATNIMQYPLACVMTSIGKDHAKFLGDTEEEIAKVKAGIFVDDAPVISAAQAEKVSLLLKDRAEQQGADFHQVEADKIEKVDFSFENGKIKQSFSYKGFDLELPLAGSWQLENAALVLETIQAINQRKGSGSNYFLSDEKTKVGIKKVKWPGRLECLGKLPSGAYLYIDGAHNPAAAGKLADSIRRYFKGCRLIFIMGVLADKDFREVLELTLPLGERLFTLKPANPRALSAESLAKTAKEMNSLEHLQEEKEEKQEEQEIQKARVKLKEIRACQSAEEALKAADQSADENCIVLSFGSLSYLKEIKKVFEDAKRK
jgi:dihydrofolate synthase / folylpolyglutamate synthase